MTGQPTHTGVYFGNGTEVPVGTPFKVIGSTYGPGTCYNFYQNGNSYIFNGAYMPTTKAPWNNNLTVSYCITLDGATESTVLPSSAGTETSTATPGTQTNNGN